MDKSEAEEYIQTLLKKLRQERERLLERVRKFFGPLKKQYVTETRYRKTIKKKFLRIIPYTTEAKDYSYEYSPLNIIVQHYFDDDVNNRVQVEIVNKISALDYCYNVVGDFPLSLFDNDDSFISNDESVIKFINQFLATAVPISKKWECMVGHIKDYETRLHVASKLEKFIESDEAFNEFYKFGGVMNELIIEKIKQWERGGG